MELTAEENLRKEKLFKIEDIIKVQKLLYGFGCEDFKTVLSDPAAVFDSLYDLELWELDEMHKNLSGDAGRIAWSLTHNFKL